MRSTLSQSFALIIFLSLSQANALYAQSFNVSPFIQAVTPTEAWIVWETVGSGDSTVTWGESTSLSNTASGDSFTNFLINDIHEVQLTGLTPNTRYYYRAESGTAESDVYDFITPPEARSEADFSLAAMSDMQIDSGNPEKFEEIVHEGIINYVFDTYGTTDLAEALAMVLIPGDLVDWGWIYLEWESDFFSPSEGLRNHVPFYPAAGNHEADAPYYFQYFHLPENGTPEFIEHWWYTDYSNLRVITLDSNFPYDSDTQLDWLGEILDETCDMTHIDFVFVQLHHPYLSELWIDGESQFTGDVIGLVESFSTDCGKPSIHFFGHTHGYSRGQSRDHQHLWVNVATAGGNIDYWGEYAQNDYPEFTVTQAEYGFVIVDVTAGDDPSFSLSRLGRGDEYTPADNLLRDTVRVRRYNENPETPTPVYPTGEDVNPDCIILTATPFEDPDGDDQSASQWQISLNCSDFSVPLIDRWTQNENWYYDINTQAGDNLWDEKVEYLDPQTDYCWRVRYRDDGLVWSDWSEGTQFSTATGSGFSNLLLNPGAELGVLGWAETSGVIESLSGGECNGISPHSGDYYFAVGAICNASAYGEARQVVDLSSFSESIDSGEQMLRWGGYLADWSGSDHPEIELRFLDDSGAELERSDRLGSYLSYWTYQENISAIPINTRSVEMILMGTRHAGEDNDSYFDDLILQIADDDEVDCVESEIPGEDTGFPDRWAEDTGNDMAFTDWREVEEVFATDTDGQDFQNEDSASEEPSSDNTATQGIGNDSCHCRTLTASGRPQVSPLLAFCFLILFLFRTLRPRPREASELLREMV
jgi:hypothetical protein